MLHIPILQCFYTSPNVRLSKGGRHWPNPLRHCRASERLFLGLFLFSGLSSWFKLFSRLCTLFLQSELAPMRKGQTKHLMVFLLQEKQVIFTQQPVPSPQDTREKSAQGSSASIASIPRAGRQHRAPAHLLAAGTVHGEGSSAAARLNEQGAGTATLSSGLPRAAIPAPRKG